MSCPECLAPRITGHPAGWMTMSHVNGCTIGAAEDATRCADYARLCGEAPWRQRYAGIGAYTRPVTAAETRLLGFAGLAAPVTMVQLITAGGAVIRRSWPGATSVPVAATATVRIAAAANAVAVSV